VSEDTGPILHVSLHLTTKRGFVAVGAYVHLYILSPSKSASLAWKGAICIEKYLVGWWINTRTIRSREFWKTSQTTERALGNMDSGSTMGVCFNLMPQTAFGTCRLAAWI
jgi:hypothetical protein